MSIAAPLHLLPSTLISHSVHESNADQAEALLTRCGPDNLGKLGSERLTYQKIFLFTTSLHSNLRRAIPIKAHIRQANQARAINEVVSAPKPEQHRTANGEDAPLRVVNDMSIQGSSMITVAARGKCMAFCH